MAIGVPIAQDREWSRYKLRETAGPDSDLSQIQERGLLLASLSFSHLMDLQLCLSPSLKILWQILRMPSSVPSSPGISLQHM